MASICLLSACGPEPGEEEAGGPLFGEEGRPSEGMTDGGKPAEGNPGAPVPGDNAQGSSTASSMTAASENAYSTAENAASVPGEPPFMMLKGSLDQMGAGELEKLELYLNEMSSYGFLLSVYEKPEDIDLNQVFYAGAGYGPQEVTEKEKKLLLERTSYGKITAPVTKVTDDQIDELLTRKAGITHEESNRGLKASSWAHIGRYSAWYVIHGDTNQQYIQCSDAWVKEDVCIVHYTLNPDLPEYILEAAMGNTAKDTSSEKAEAAASAKTEAETAAEEFAEDNEKAVSEDDFSEEESSAASVTGAVTQESSEKAAESASKTGATAAAASKEMAEEGKSAFYNPVYEAMLRKTADGWQFCSNKLWIQKELIEAQSYRAELEPVGEVFFAPYYPRTEVDAGADVSFALIQGGALLSTLSGMEPDNIRPDRIFKGVDSVDFTDYNGDDCTDILTVCSYTKVGADGKKGGELREARIYTGTSEGVPYLDEDKTAAVNRNVETLNISNITNYLEGKSDGKNKKYQSWKEAYTDQIKNIDEDEYEGFALIYLNDDRVPELVQVGASSAKGSTIVIYRSGALDETWLNRRKFQYLEYENMLLSASGMENLHYDTIYSIVGGRLGISVQGYYGNESFARVQFDDNGKESYDYIWDGGNVSRSGYRDGLLFVFDTSRAKTAGEEQLMTKEELLEKLK